MILRRMNDSTVASKFCVGIRFWLKALAYYRRNNLSSRNMKDLFYEIFPYKVQRWFLHSNSCLLDQKCALFLHWLEDQSQYFSSCRMLWNLTPYFWKINYGRFLTIPKKNIFLFHMWHIHSPAPAYLACIKWGLSWKQIVLEVALIRHDSFHFFKNLEQFVKIKNGRHEVCISWSPIKGASNVGTKLF